MKQTETLFDVPPLFVQIGTTHEGARLLGVEWLLPPGVENPFGSLAATIGEDAPFHWQVRPRKAYFDTHPQALGEEPWFTEGVLGAVERFFKLTLVPDTLNQFRVLMEAQKLSTQALCGVGYHFTEKEHLTPQQELLDRHGLDRFSFAMKGEDWDSHPYIRTHVPKRVLEAACQLQTQFENGLDGRSTEELRNLFAHLRFVNQTASTFFRE